jgi:hypothetical protein
VKIAPNLAETESCPNLWAALGLWAVEVCSYVWVAKSKTKAKKTTWQSKISDLKTWALKFQA